MKQLSTTPLNSFKLGKNMAAPMHRETAREKAVNKYVSGKLVGFVPAPPGERHFGPIAVFLAVVLLAFCFFPSF